MTAAAAASTSKCRLVDLRRPNALVHRDQEKVSESSSRRPDSADARSACHPSPALPTGETPTSSASVAPIRRSTVANDATTDDRGSPSATATPTARTASATEGS